MSNTNMLRKYVLKLPGKEYSVETFLHCVWSIPWSENIDKMPIRPIAHLRGSSK